MGYKPGAPEERKYQISHLWEIHHEILRRLIMGQLPREIAMDLGITEQTVSNTRNSELGQLVLEVLRTERDGEAADISKIVREEAEASFLFLRQIRRGEIDASVNQRIRVAMDILDREPELARVRRVEGRVVHAHYTREEIEEIKHRALLSESEAVREGSVTIDAEYEQVEES